jgi:sec-independent protein translocase protein TatA
MPGMGELLIILLIVLLIFGAGKLPAIGDALGRSIKNFRRSASGNDEIEVNKSDKKAVKGAKRKQLEESDDEDFEDAEVVAKAKEEA